MTLAWLPLGERGHGGHPGPCTHRSVEWDGAQGGLALAFLMCRARLHFDCHVHIACTALHAYAVGVLGVLSCDVRSRRRIQRGDRGMGGPVQGPRPLSWEALRSSIINEFTTLRITLQAESCLFLRQMLKSW